MIFWKRLRGNICLLSQSSVINWHLLGDTWLKVTHFTYVKVYTHQYIRKQTIARNTWLLQLKQSTRELRKEEVNVRTCIWIFSLSLFYINKNVFVSYRQTDRLTKILFDINSMYLQFFCHTTNNIQLIYLSFLANAWI